MSAQLIEALKLAANRLDVLALDHDCGTTRRNIADEWAKQARAALAAAEAQPVREDRGAVEYAADRIAFDAGVRWGDLGHQDREKWRERARAALYAAPVAQPVADSEADAFERGRQQGMKQERALWVLAKEGQAMEPDTFVQPVAVPQAETMLKHACRVGTDFYVHRYLMSNADGRWDGAEKAVRHQELCRFYVAVVHGCDCLDLAAREHPEAVAAVHEATSEFTGNLDEEIGFPLKGRPDYEALVPLFFERFHYLAMTALAAAPAAPAVQPLTDADIEAVMNPCDHSDLARHLRRQFIESFKRVYFKLHPERAHGITGPAA